MHKGLRKLDQASSIAEFDRIHTMAMSMKEDEKKKPTTTSIDNSNPSCASSPQDNAKPNNEEKHQEIKKIRGAALRDFERLLAEKDETRSYCGLQRLLTVDDGMVIWTTEEHAKQLKANQNTDNNRLFWSENSSLWIHEETSNLLDVLEKRLQGQKTNNNKNENIIESIESNKKPIQQETLSSFSNERNRRSDEEDHSVIASIVDVAIMLRRSYPIDVVHRVVLATRSKLCERDLMMMLSEEDWQSLFDAENQYYSTTIASELLSSSSVIVEQQKKKSVAIEDTVIKHQQQEPEQEEAARNHQKSVLNNNNNNNNNNNRSVGFWNNMLLCFSNDIKVAPI
jgi:hypothetical protein